MEREQVERRRAAARELVAELASRPGTSDKTKVLLALAGTYAGYDADKMLEMVKTTRGRTVF